jgi:hypothetical protein
MSEISATGSLPYRPLTDEERRLIQWMLENGLPEAKTFLPQLDTAEATSWRCRCGCASFNLAIAGHEAPPGRMHILADFMFGERGDECGIMIWENEGLLVGVEVSGYAVDAPKSLPKPESLRPFVAVKSS